jgi:hypothetical protein
MSPELYFSLYCPENGFELEKVVVASLSDRRRHFTVSKPTRGHRITLYSNSPIYVMTIAKKIADVDRLRVWQSDYEYIWSANKSNSVSHEIIKQSKSFSNVFKKYVKRIRILISPSKNFALLNAKNEYISPVKIGGN